MSHRLYDLVVIGGGVNGAGIAADAAGRGLKVLLAEADDLAGATSSASSKLIHGGLRYLEHWEFRLVREALAEREVLLSKAPHIVWPLKFVLPHAEGMRPRPLLKAGLFLYDHLASRRTLGASSSVDLSLDPAGHPLKKQYRHAFTYWDCWVDDARLVVENAKAARSFGAEILTRTPVTALRIENDIWEIVLGVSGSEQTVGARAVINAAGPWVGAVSNLVSFRDHPHPHVNMVKGSHIVVPRIAGADDAYIFQNVDKRVVFALPYESAFTLIGTTDVPFTGDPRTAAVSAAEEDYLVGLANRYFQVTLTTDDIVWRYSGVRPLDDDGSQNPSAASRDYRLDLDPGPPAILHVIGGKITTYRRLAEAALAKLSPHLPPMKPAWTAAAPLPGGSIGRAGFDKWFMGLRARKPGFAPGELLRLARRYGTETETILGNAQSADALGSKIAGLSEAEIRYLKTSEWAMTANDALWRRTKAGLHVAASDRARVAGSLQSVIDRLC